MARNCSLVAVAAATVIMALGALTAAAQLPLSPVRDAGQTVTPAYEGWYPNADGTFMLSFGYYNRNREQVVDVPLGPDNLFEGGRPDLGQPTRFHPGRHWGVFTVRVPAAFGDQRLVWTLRTQGQTFAIPGHLEGDWLLDAKHNPASGNRPPVLEFDPEGQEGTGPDGVTTGPLEARVGRPLSLTVWATDDGIQRAGGSRRQTEPILLRWFKHRGPGEVEFTETEPEVDHQAGGKALTVVTFSSAGDYVLRVRANDYSGVSGGGHAQCCWTNGYVKVTVTD